MYTPVAHPLLFLCRIWLYVNVPQCVSIYPLKDISVCFQFGAIMTNAVVNICVHVFVWTWVFIPLEKSLEIGILRLDWSAHQLPQRMPCPLSWGGSGLRARPSASRSTCLEWNKLTAWHLICAFYGPLLLYDRRHWCSIFLSKQIWNGSQFIEKS